MVQRRQLLIAASLLPSKIVFGRSLDSQEQKKIKTVLVTGGTSGIGEGTVRYLAAKNYQVAFCGRRKELGKKIESDLTKAGFRARYFFCDIRESEQVTNFVNESIKLFSKVDCLFANAGISHVPSMIHQMDHRIAKNIFETNYWGTLNCVSAILPHMIGNKSGSIILNTSFGVNCVIKGEAVYASSKNALETLVDHLANEYAQFNIRSYSIQPLCVRTPALENRAKYLKRSIEKIGNILLGRLIEPSEIAEVVNQLILSETPIMSGSHIDLSAGQWR